MLRANKINRLKEKAKKIACAMIGVNVGQLILTNEEKHQLINEGYHLSGGRNNQLILTYPQESRVKDIKNKVLNK